MNLQSVVIFFNSVNSYKIFCLYILTLHLCHMRTCGQMFINSVCAVIIRGSVKCFCLKCGYRKFKSSLMVYVMLLTFISDHEAALHRADFREDFLQVLTGR